MFFHAVMHGLFDGFGNCYLEKGEKNIHAWKMEYYDEMKKKNISYSLHTLYV